MREIRLWIGGKWQRGELQREIKSPFSGKAVATVHYASESSMAEACNAAQMAFDAARKLSRYTRAQLLRAMADEIARRRSEFVTAIVEEAGKPATLADAEVTRALITVRTAAEEVLRFTGELLAVDHDAASRVYAPAQSFWVPRGPVLGITPFNFPLNLVAHKVAPALAAGTSIVIKAAPQAPGPAVLLAEVFEAAAQKVSDARDKVPMSMLQVVSCSNEVASAAVKSPVFGVMSFTGSTKVGWFLQRESVGKKVALELGGNAAVIICADGDLARAAARCAVGGYAYAGQSCISVQRIFVEESVRGEFEKKFLEEVGKVKSGDPSQGDVSNGPLIDRAATDRVMAWIGTAVQAGARVLTGGKIIAGPEGGCGNVIEPTVLTNVSPTQPIACEEVFGPVTILESFKNLTDAITRVNDSRFGLQAGVFTQNAHAQERAVAELDVGGVLINEIPTFRADPLPYGGAKESGLGREGVRFAMEEFSERKTVVRYVG